MFYRCQLAISNVFTYYINIDLPWQDSLWIVGFHAFVSKLRSFQIRKFQFSIFNFLHFVQFSHYICHEWSYSYNSSGLTERRLIRILVANTNLPVFHRLSFSINPSEIDVYIFAAVCQWNCSILRNRFKRFILLSRQDNSPIHRTQYPPIEQFAVRENRERWQENVSWSGNCYFFVNNALTYCWKVKGEEVETLEMLHDSFVANVVSLIVSFD